MPERLGRAVHAPPHSVQAGATSRHVGDGATRSFAEVGNARQPAPVAGVATVALHCARMKKPTLISYCIFEYQYRDAGNWKTQGELLLNGRAEDASDALRQCLESGDLFVAEQVGVPSLCEEHFSICGEGPSDLDHAYHEFIALRPATDEDVATLQVAGSLDDLLLRMRKAAGRWDVTLSPNCGD